MKRISVVVAFTAMLLSPALALEDFSKVRCEMPGVQKAVLEILPGMKLEDGSTFAQHLDASAITEITTLKADKNTLVCRLTMNVGYGANRRFVRGKFTFKQFGNGKLSATWAPLY